VVLPVESYQFQKALHAAAFPEFADRPPDVAAIAAAPTAMTAATMSAMLIARRGFLMADNLPQSHARGMPQDNSNVRHKPSIGM
jgi:hypothetical protein